MAAANWASTAEADLEEIYSWIAHQSGRRLTAKKISRDLRNQCEELGRIFARGSTIGTPRPEFGEDFRVFTHQRWVIVFRPDANGIEVMRVIDGSRDYPLLF